MYRRILFAGLAGSVVLPTVAHADENGISFWLPGQYGSFAATPATPGWSWATIYYHGSVGAGSDQQFPRGGEIDVGLSGRADLIIFGPSYTFETQVLNGAQLTLSVLTAGGHSEASADAVLTGPGGVPISGKASDSLTGFGDLYPSATLKWNRRVNNFMTYSWETFPSVHMIRTGSQILASDTAP